MIKKIESIAVYCASSLGDSDDYKKLATKLGEEIALNGKQLVYGGAKVGLMGAVADGALSQRGIVKGVIPLFLQEKELQHEQLSEMYVVNTMHERKAKMADLADAFIAMPGGFGTMEELFEVLTWSQLAIHKKPVALLNINHYYDKLLDFIQVMCEQKFIKAEHRNMLIVSDDPQKLLEKIDNFVPLSSDKWFDPIK